jgi:hypothetical protein
MSTAVQQTEITSPTQSAWTQIDGTPLTGRKYVKIINQDTNQGIGVIFTTGSTPTGNWDTGEKILPGDKGDLEPCEGAVHVYVKTQTGSLTSGAGIIFREYN